MMANTMVCIVTWQYDLTLTVTGPGYQTPGGGGDPTTLDVQCVVVPFGYVSQDVEI